MLYLFGLLAHWRLLLPSTVSFYPEEAPCIPQKEGMSPYSPECVEEEFCELPLYGDASHSYAC